MTLFGVEPSWLFGTAGFIFGVIGFFRGRTASMRLENIERMLADRLPATPDDVVERIIARLPEVRDEYGTLQPRGTADLRRGLEMLPEHQRAALTLKFELELSDAEIASLLGFDSRTNVSAAIDDALQTLASGSGSY